MPRASLIAASCTLFLLAAGRSTVSAQSGESLKRLSLEALGDIEVTTTSKEPETLKRTPAAVYVLTSEDIRRSAATSVAELLRLVPGLQVSRMDGNHWAVGVRGFANQFSQSLLVMIDGRSVYTPLFAGVQWSVQDTLLEDIERIEIIRGPGATIWGANAVNGVINIITKKAKDTQGATASVGGGTIDHAIAGVRYGGRRGYGLDYRVFAKGFQRGPQTHSDGHDFDSWRAARAGFRTDWSGSGNDITLQGDVYKGRDGQAVAFGSFTPPAQLVSYDPVDVSGGNLLAHWRREFAGGDDAQVHAYYDRTSQSGPQIGETRNTFDVDFIHQLARVPRQTIIWGLGARVSPTDITQMVPTLDVVPHQQSNSIYSLFAQDEVAVAPNRLWVTAGAKFERNNFTGLEVQPSLRVLWMPGGSHSVWGGVARAVRTPSLLEEGLQLTGFLQAAPPAFLRVRGNPAFKSEVLVGYEAGYRGVITSQLYVDVALYHNEHDNLQSLGAPTAMVETTPGPPHLLLVFPYDNGVMGKSDGFEVSPDWQPARQWQIKGSYSYLQVDLKLKPGATDTSAVTRYEGSSPRHQAFIRSMFTLPHGVELDQTVRYASRLPAQNVSAYTAFDLRAGWQFAPRLTISISGENLTDADHVEFAHTPPPAVALGRAVYASLTWNR